ncbi:hypothetical protein QBC40DRAFT_15568 [Triangularia verruculosa]|uniref:Uncharacterized protein n=1 Tax=Triangularia verruculosa TaxID=2587418 RepID=A0AAN6X8W3_9PEZI|nr:hypothetical protein QBC40DRAFT_15568 [Triangularia verruculosa]
MDSSVAASMLTRQRISVALFSLAATATLGFYCYRFYNPPYPEPNSRLHRSNAVRHRRRSITNNHVAQEQPGRAPSEASYTSAESHADENADVDRTVRPLADGETVADDAQELDDNWYDDDNNQYGPQARAGQNIVSLLFRVSEDNARRSAYVHRGCQCNGCGIVPIRGIRYRCANCADFDLCETCESQGLHTKTHIFYKIKVPAPRLGPRQLQPVWYPGDPENCLRLLPKRLMAKLSKETGFERPELEALWEQWTFMANTEWREDPDELCLAMDRRTFERYLVPSGDRQPVPNLLHDRMFAFYDDNNDDLIGFSEFLRGTSYRKRKDRLRKIFDGYDVDGDGFVSRRDFLRLFRAYYVLFKQMHKDILEGLDDQVMSSTEVQQLGTSRAPLSSLFGREGIFQPAETDRPLEGKVVNESLGEVHISDGNPRAVAGDSPDVSDRQSVLNDLFTKRTQTQESLFVLSNNGPSTSRETSIEYLNALLNPPTRTSELPTIIVGESPRGDQLMLVMNGSQLRNDNNGDQATGSGEQAPHRVENGASPPGEEASDNSREDEGRVEGRHLVRVPYIATSNRRLRVEARKKLFDRWKRRQFYLDEEEGAVAPDGWPEDEDVLTHMNPSSESSKAPHQPVLSRSRSSSKVRFADDDDDYDHDYDTDARSNVSNSSRSIPERWGGMEIPDAERDVGKEIFYQVIQQAFNEILDTLFKRKEDLAVKAAETKGARDKWRHCFASINLDEVDKKKHKGAKKRKPAELSLEELLATSGYSVDQNEIDGTTAVGSASEIVPDELPVMPPGEPIESPSSPEVVSHRDPTMPQFRPNAGSESEAARDSLSDEDSNRSNKTADTAETSTKTSKKGGSASPPSFEQLVEWKRLDVAEQESKKRGGWGRLNYEEFEHIYKEEEANGSRLDYLGTWIDFCIPYH